jgi:uncharacterized protein (TIGR04222 family)
MFPFDLRGPEFIVFYALFSAVVIGAVWILRRRDEAGTTAHIDATNPYLFACLRGGPVEVVRVATLALIDRNQLDIRRGEIRWGSRPWKDPRRPRIEQVVMRYFEQPGRFAAIARDRAVLAVAEADYEEELRRHRLVPDETARQRRRALLRIAVIFLVGVGGVKLGVALMAGRSNVLFLIVMMMVALYVGRRSLNPYRTRAGDDVLANIRSMFAGLRQRRSLLRAGSGSREMLWLTALFGAASLPTAAFPFIRDFHESSAIRAGTSCSAGGGGSGGGGASGGGCGGCGGGCGGCGS